MRLAAPIAGIATLLAVACAWTVFALYRVALLGYPCETGECSRPEGQGLAVELLFAAVAGVAVAALCVYSIRAARALRAGGDVSAALVRGACTAALFPLWVIFWPG